MKKILTCTFIALFGLLATANVLLNRQADQLSDITLTAYLAQADPDGSDSEQVDACETCGNCTYIPMRV